MSTTPRPGPGPYARDEPLTLSDRLARIGGARGDVIRDAEGDKPRFVRMGVVIITTAVFAALSATFALLIIELPIPLAIPIGLLWGLAIFNLDQLLIVSMPYQEGRTPGQTIGLAVPRLVLALIIGLVISTPVTLFVFDKEIGPMVIAIQDEKEDAYTAQIEGDARYNRIPQLEKDLVAAQKVVAGEGIVDLASDPTYKAAKAAYDEALALYTTAQATWEAELNGSGGTGVPGAGPVAAQKKEARDLAAAALRTATSDLASAKTTAETNLGKESSANADNAQAEVDRIQKELTDLRVALANEKKVHTALQGNSDGLLLKLEALHRLSTESWIMGLAHGMLAALFVSLELLPVVMKTIMNFGKPTAYDRVAKLTDDAVVSAGGVFAKNRLKAAQADAESELDVAKHRADLQRIEGTKLNEIVVKHQSAAVRAALKVWGVYAKKRTTDRVHEYEHDLSGGTAGGAGAASGGSSAGGAAQGARPGAAPTRRTDLGDRTGVPAQTGFRPTAAPKAAPYSETIGFPDPDVAG